VVDDEPSLRSFAALLLEDLGYASLVAENGRAAVQLLLQQDPGTVHLVLLDMTMPGLPPEETFRQLTEIQPGLPILILSGEPETVVRRRFGSGTIAGYLQKPYTDLELEAALAQALAQPAPAPAAFQLARVSEQEQQQARQEYLAAQRQEVRQITDLLAARDFDSLRLLGHRLKGSGGCFGFPEITRIGGELEAAAGAADLAACRAQLDALTDCLREL
jgi:CheY-like chemotaxis protein